MNGNSKLATYWTEKEFYVELCRFRELMGSKTFWAQPKEKRDGAIGGITMMYLNLAQDDGSLPTSEQMEKWGGIFDSTLTEFSRRELYVETGL